MNIRNIKIIHRKISGSYILQLLIEWMKYYSGKRRASDSWVPWLPARGGFYSGDSNWMMSWGCLNIASYVQVQILPCAFLKHILKICYIKELDISKYHYCAQDISSLLLVQEKSAPSGPFQNMLLRMDLSVAFTLFPKHIWTTVNQVLL